MISQTKDNNYYTLVKDGKKYLKPIKYVMLENEEDKKIISNNSEDIIFYINWTCNKKMDN